MTVEQALNMLDPKRLLVFRGKVIFNSWDEQEAAYWSASGATVTPFYSEQGIKFGKPAKPGWEVEMSGACEKVTVTKLTGEVEDITRLELVKEARKRRKQVGV